MRKKLGREQGIVAYCTGSRESFQEKTFEESWTRASYKKKLVGHFSHSKRANGTHLFWRRRLS